MQRCTGLAHEGKRRTCNPTSVLYMYFRVVDLGEMMLIGKERPGRALTCLSHSKICLTCLSSHQFLKQLRQIIASLQYLLDRGTSQSDITARGHSAGRQSRNRREILGIPSYPEQNLNKTRTRRHFRATARGILSSSQASRREAVGRD
jgi:hypothetical protein